MNRTVGPINFAVTLALAMAVGCAKTVDQARKPEAGLRFVEKNCPDHTAIRYVTSNDSVVTLDSLSVSGKITLIPEFHDCQRLIDTTGLQYGALVGIFVSFQNALIPLVPPVPPAGPGTTAPAASPVAPLATGPVIAAAELVSFDGDYDTLGIKLGFNCLYLINDDSPSRVGARMVPVGAQEKDCGKSYDPAMGGKALIVTPEYPELNASDYPPVARWEWDPNNNVHVIGIKCRITWCNVAPEGIHPSPAMDVSAVEAPSTDERRTFVIRGWHDEQRLGVPLSSTTLAPGIPVGTIVPDKDLGNWNSVDDFKHWKQVARIFFSPNSAVYKSKFGFAGTTGGDPPQAMTRVSFCQGADCSFQGQPAPTCTPSSDGYTWYSKIDPIGASKPTYRCVIRQVMTIGGTIYDPPATARWRWSDTDETLWARCAQGCCQVG
jgi:hypothetical protein